MSLSYDLNASATQFIIDRGTDGPSIEEIIDHVKGLYAHELEQYADKAKREYIRSILKTNLKKQEELDEGPRFPGFDVPRTITVPVNEGKTIYVAFENATYQQAHDHVLMKERNIFHAMEEKRKYEDALAKLEPEWVENKELPAGEIMRRVGGEFPDFAA